MTKQSLQDVIQTAGSAINMLRAHKFNRPENPNTYETPNIIPAVPHEFSSWELESKSWRSAVSLLDLSHHMVGCYITGADAQKLLGFLSCNSLFKSEPVSASQIICVNDEGQLIGDGIVTHLGDNRFSIYGAPMVPVWVEFQAQKQKLDVKVQHDQRTPPYAHGHQTTRPRFCYQIQGPLAAQLITKLNGGPMDDVRFFGMTEVTIAGHRLQALRHGMAGAVGLEVVGPWELRDEVRNAIVTVGQEFGLTLVGSGAYLCTAIESGWYQAVLPAIYEGDALKDFREWIPSDDHFAVMRLQGSKTYNELSGYYRTPYDLGYGNFINFDHEFMGRDALMTIDKEQAFKKVTLAWDPDDVAALMREMVTPGGRNVRMLHLPNMADKIGAQYDTLTHKGNDVGNSAYTAYSVNERSVLSLALVNQSVQVGDEVVIGWGEAGGGYGNFKTAANDIFEIKARVSPVPYAAVTRDNYRK